MGRPSWIEARLDCNICSTDFAIAHNDKQVPKLVRNADLQRQAELERKVQDKRREIQDSAEFRNIRSAVESGLSTCRSAAARHRFLVNAGLSYKSLASYRRDPSYMLVADNALKAAKALQIGSPNLEKMTADLVQRQQAARIDIPAIETGLKRLEK